MTKVVASVLLILAFFAHASPAAATQNYDKSTAKRTAKFGDLVVRVTGMVSTESAPHKGDRHKVAVFVSASNMGKGAVCASLGASLQATFGLEFVGFGGSRVGDPPFPEAPQIYQLLPGQGAEGSYVFDVKDGVAPLRLVLKLSNRTIRCGPPWADTFAPQEVRLDVRDLPAPAEDLRQQARSTQQPEAYTMAEYTAYKAAAEEQNTLVKVKLLDDFIAQYPNSGLLVYVYYEAAQTYYKLDDYPNAIKYADEVLSLGDKAGAERQYFARLVRDSSQQKLQRASR